MSSPSKDQARGEASLVVPLESFMERHPFEFWERKKGSLQEVLGSLDNGQIPHLFPLWEL